MLSIDISPYMMYIIYYEDIKKETDSDIYGAEAG